MHTKTHRHFVAVPLTIVLMIVIAGTHTLIPAGAAELTRASDVRFAADSVSMDFDVGWMIAGTLEPSSVLRANNSGEALELVTGQALIRSIGFTELAVDSVKVHALAASYVALRDRTSVTVAALSSFVIVTTQHETVILAPGMQMTFQEGKDVQTAPVPEHWYAEKLQAAQLLRESIIPDGSRDHPAHRDLQAVLAQTLRDGRIISDVFASAHSAAEDVDGAGMAQRLLLLRLLQEGTRTDTDASLALAEQIAADRFLSIELVSLLPHTVKILMRPVADEHIRFWEKSALSRGLEDREAVLALLHQNVLLPQQLLRAGYPQQSALWQRALSSVGTTLRTTLSAQEVQSLDKDLAVINRSDVATESDNTAVTPVYIPATHWSEAELLQIVREQLFTGRVLTAVTTQLAPDTPTQTVRVTGVFMAEQGTDVPYDFTFDVARQTISAIVRDGKNLPNSVPVEQFFR